LRRPTTSAIFIDTNIPIYAAGVEHPLKQPSEAILELVAVRRGAFTTDAEVLQELIHRYLALGRWPQGAILFDRFATLMRRNTAPILGADVERAAELAMQHSDLSARDLIHVAVMQRLGVERIITADTGFDRVPEVGRLDPARFEEWRNDI